MKKTISVLLAAVLMLSVMSFGAWSIDDQSVRVTNITIESPAKVKTGATAQLNYTLSPENASNKEITWETSSKLITVDSKGQVTANRFIPFSDSYSFLKIPSFGGSATVKATTDDGGYTATCTVKVSPDIWNILLLATLIGIVVVPMFLTPAVVV